jgi:vanillate O-demethylase ferredoxin subunit
VTALEVRVARIVREAHGVKAFSLEPATAEPLPAFEPGAHIEVRGRIATGEAAWRAYSIVSDPSQTHAYEIGVLRVGDRGVSAWLHDHVQVGDVLTIAPRATIFRWRPTRPSTGWWRAASASRRSSRWRAGWSASALVIGWW